MFGFIMKNTEKKSEKSPDYTGELGTLRLACWVKTSKSGRKYLSLSAEPAEPEAVANAPAIPDDNDPLPF